MRRITLGAAGFAIAAGAVLLGAGTAAAIVPVAQPDDGRIGLQLDHSETTALAQGPLPALIGLVVPAGRVGAGLHQDTQLYKDDRGGVHASLRQVIMEAADHPDGSVSFFLDAPGSHGPRLLDIYQRWN
ncbi:hypothetical protein [Nocardia sp. alder85J]|uniref:hypothetical protein n=1 Tax=Nocardia sp. alder85J TaxID=2862949 RepID=UPI001CD1CE11|nr:hypothetical protein [Nocardia sp. alder85J]MCX4098772.1 hypothetical protein [Nocardia sp. alder85J]